MIVRVRFVARVIIIMIMIVIVIMIVIMIVLAGNRRSRRENEPPRLDPFRSDQIVGELADRSRSPPQ